MSLNVGNVSNQAAKLNQCIEYLRSVKNSLVTGKQDLVSNWSDDSTGKVLAAIDKQVSKIDELIKECSSIANDMNKAAYNIVQEEIARQKAESMRG